VQLKVTEAKEKSIKCKRKTEEILTGKKEFIYIRESVKPVAQKQFLRAIFI
jgi:hypothetical protein